MGLDAGLVVLEMNLLRVGELTLRTRDVLRDIHQDRARATGRRDVEGLLDRTGEIAHVFDQVVVLGDRPREAHVVGLLKRVASDELGCNLTGEDHDGNGIGIGGRNPGDRIRKGRARGHDRNAGPAGGAGKAVRHMDGALFVAGQHMPELMAMDRIVDVEDGATRVAKDHLHALLAKCPEEYIGAIGFHASLLARRGVAPVRQPSRPGCESGGWVATRSKVGSGFESRPLGIEAE